MENYKLFKLYEPISKELLELTAKEYGIDPDVFENYNHPQEDFLVVSEKYPIFAVADGVTLEPELDLYYPNPSGAGEAARIFCDTFISEAEKQYEILDKKGIQVIFRKGNAAVGKYNAERGRTHDKINYWDFDLFAATAAFVVIKGDTFWWGSICDSAVAQFDKTGKQKFVSPECWPNRKTNLPSGWNELSEREKKLQIRKIYRNGLDEKGERIGYGVVTGDKAAEKYFNIGKLAVSQGDMVFITTDGFEAHLKRTDFIKLFCRWEKNLKTKVKKYTTDLTKKNPRVFGHERSLVAIKF